MQRQARLPEILVQNCLSVPTQVFQECLSGIPPPTHLPTHENENLARLRDFGFELVWSTPPPQTYVGAGFFGD